MFGDQKDIQKNLKDPSLDLDVAIKDISVPLTYIKINKLITALYIVTDIIDKEEPLRLKLRTLGVEILSDITTMTRSNLVRNIQGVLSFLDIAFTMNMVSEMNKNILVNEFTQLKNSLIVPQDSPVWLEEFLKEPARNDTPSALNGKLELSSKRHPKHTRIGVQKGSTLMKALSDRTLGMSDIGLDNFALLKKQRRDNIINIIKNNGGSANIKDIKNNTNADLQGTPLYSEKTLQRELMFMIKDGVLYKTGEKRWSKYFLK